MMVPTRMPRITAEEMKARSNSDLRRGTVMRSAIMPWYFMIMMEEEGFWKALLIIPIMMRPGTMKAKYGMSPTVWTLLESESPKIVRNRRLETTGASTVWVHTLVKRAVSRLNKVQVPSGLSMIIFLF